MKMSRWPAVLLIAVMTAIAGGAAVVAQDLSAVRKLTAFTLGGGEQNVIPPGTPRLQFTPDEHVSFLRQSNGTYTLWAASGPYGTYAFSTPDLVHLTRLKTAGKAPAGVLVESGKGTTAYDADYAGAGTVLPAANGTDLLMFYHAENHFFGGKDYQTFPFYASVGLARSSDGGIYVLTSPDLINWSPGMLVLNAPVPDGSVTLGNSPFNWYPTIVSPDQASDRLSSQTGYLYYAKSTGANSQHVMYRQAFTITAN